ncbi:MAG: poly-beta-1,6-N-acetyl-D-glucosamine biosynthesis protein PgaD [Comamonadaceae bacterium]|nr:MAG: poly-beta-1,6-N-acetyl-D-glucosamine biosynthesis protein PgaD [Comamonadaceae bacterium]
MIVTTERSFFDSAFDFLLTLLAWIGFIYLIAGGVLAVLHGGLTGPALPFWSKLLPTVNTLLIYVIAATCNGLVLVAWAQYNRLRFGGLDRRKAFGPLLDDRGVAGFCATQQLLSQLRRARISTVHQDSGGRVDAVDLPAPRLAVVPAGDQASVA